MGTNTFAHIAKRTAQITFGLGTLLLISLLITEAEGLFTLGFIYLSVAIIFNLITLLIMFIRIILFENGRFEIFKNTLLMLVNIPIAFLYIQIVLN